jgi:hypothetical protein
MWYDVDVVHGRDLNERLHNETETRPRRSKKHLETASRRSRPRPNPRQDRDETETLTSRDETRPRRSKKRLDRLETIGSRNDRFRMFLRLTRIIVTYCHAVVTSKY